MARTKLEHPTPAELEALQVLWQRGPSTVREVMEALEATRKGRAYTSVMSLLNLMVDKRLVKRQPQGRAFLYIANVERQKTLTQMVHDLCRRAFAGSTSALVAHMLDHNQPTKDELREIRQAIDGYLAGKDDGG
ncbi:MAG: BlaI/MecI/CopY family transcriptional regulator [Pirellulaceae bacterium]|nr:BlaI/MecI/CopY family transcriptional regulator [Planctomycetales bacterium]